ncbi:MAG: hypothetical protein RR614_04990, partial [Eubacterium sp.]
EKELQDLESLEKSPSEETASLAGFYLSNLEVTPVEDIEAPGVFLAEYSIDESVKAEKIDYVIQCLVMEGTEEKEVIYKNEETASIQYYQPIEISEVKYASDNQDTQA